MISVNNQLHNNLSMASSEEWVSTVSHELRTPLTSILGVLGLLSTGKLGELSTHGQHLLEIALKNTQRVMRVTNLLESDANLTQYPISEDLLHQFRLERDLNTALKSESLQLYYQPIVNLETQEITGFEALVRWYHPQQGWISPDVFIPIAESTGLIHELGLWVLRKACQQLHYWQQQYPRDTPLTMSVNLSTIQLLYPALGQKVQDVLVETRISPHSLKLEITESAMMVDQSHAIAILQELESLGIHLYLDDFGTGYSSLSRLYALPVMVLKIDRSFILQKNWTIIEVILSLAESLKLKVVAEGIETKEDLEQLKQLGCSFGQGYYFSRPRPVEEISSLLEL